MRNIFSFILKPTPTLSQTEIIQVDNDAFVKQQVAGGVADLQCSPPTNFAIASLQTIMRGSQVLTMWFKSLRSSRNLA